MPITKTVILYQFAELDDKAKDKARDWFRSVLDIPDYSDHVIGDACRFAELLGIDFATYPVKLYNGATRDTPSIYWSGFSSQGDGASFEGRYRYAKGGLAAVMKEAPKDETLHAIGKRLQAIQSKHFYRLTASVNTSGNYSHSHSMNVDVESSNSADECVHNDVQNEITDCMRSFADWIYSNLRSEYEYQMSDESVDENIEANEYTFTVDGRRED